MELTAATAAWLLPAALPISLYVAWSDMQSMKIPNRAVYALAAGFAVLGLFALAPEAWLWRWVHLSVALLAGIALYAVRAIGAGDAKFAAAAAAYVAPGDVTLVFWLFCICAVAAYVTHRAVKHSPVRRLAPDWASWSSGNRFPMGFPLGTTLILYLLLGLVQGL